MPGKTRTSPPCREVITVMRTCSLVPPIRPGIRAHARAVFPYPLPRGLAEGSLVSVERVEDGRCTVRDRAGKQWTVPVVSIDPGQLVWQDGQWVPEAKDA